VNASPKGVSLRICIAASLLTMVMGYCLNGYIASLGASRQIIYVHQAATLQRNQRTVQSQQQQRDRHETMNNTTPLLLLSQQWLNMPAGWNDNDSYDDIADTNDYRCQSTSPISTKNNNNDWLTVPWWYEQLVANSICGGYQTIHECHSSPMAVTQHNNTCQWTLQGYCINYTQPSKNNDNIGNVKSLPMVWWQFEVYPGGLTNQHW
jgi:hypothetical protein